jgi:outer membrane lipoprotein-sorting protein
MNMKRKLIPALAAIAVVIAIPASAQDATQIMKKAQALMTGAKTYQSVTLVTTDAGKMGSMTTRMEAKSSGHKSAVTTTAIGQPTGQLAMMGAMSNMTMVDDGKTIYMYMPAMKRYMKRPSTGRKQGQGNVRDMLGGMKDASFKLVGTESVNGKPAHVIEVKPKKPMQGLQGMNLKFYVAKDSNLVQQVKMDGKAPGMGGEQNIKVTMLIQSQTLNAPIPDSVFRFTPPPGATEGSPFGGAGGGPGGGPAPSRR